MSNIEYGSYATHLERRVIMPQWHSDRRRAGRFTFKTMSKSNDTTWNTLVGHEMTLDNSYRRSTEAQPEDKWIFRSFLDGTAFYNYTRLHNNLYSWNAKNKIEKVIEKYFYLDTTLQSPIPTHSGQRYHHTETIRVYKRKPLSDYSRTVALAQEASLGDYLVRKYNIGGVDATTVQS